MYNKKKKLIFNLIGQVHAAVLRETGENVVIKVINFFLIYLFFLF